MVSKGINGVILRDYNVSLGGQTLCFMSNILGEGVCGNDDEIKGSIAAENGAKSVGDQHGINADMIALDASNNVARASGSRNWEGILAPLIGERGRAASQYIKRRDAAERNALACGLNINYGSSGRSRAADVVTQPITDGAVEHKSFAVAIAEAVTGVGCGSGSQKGGLPEAIAGSVPE